MPDPSCAERIAAHAESRLADFAALIELAHHADDIDADNDPAAYAELIALAESQDIGDLDNLSEASTERIYEYPLAVSTLRVHAVSTLRVHKIELSPADWLEVFVDDEGDITRIVYHFADWFDHAEVTLDHDDFKRAEDFVTALIPEL